MELLSGNLARGRAPVRGCGWSLVFVLLAAFAAGWPAHAQVPQPVVAIHDSELNRALEVMVATNGTPTGPGTTGFQWWVTNWHYFFMPDSVKEALRSDGTPFAVVGDSNILSGALLNSNGLPNYPILVSLASEAVADPEITALTNYVAAGGTLLVGGSAFTRSTNGTTRGDFAIANAMGVHMSSPTLGNWTANVTFSKLVNAPLVSHIPGGVLDWNMPVSADETCWGMSSSNPAASYLVTQGHLIWRVQAANATVIAQADATPYLLTNSFGKGTIIYIAALEPFLAHGGNGSGMFAYGILRNAIQGAFANANLPIPRLSPWQFPYAAALEVRHDLENLQDQISQIQASAQFESTNGAKGDYYFCTGTLRVEMTNSQVVIGNLRSAVTNYGATIGPHNGWLANINNFSLVLSNYDYWHWGTDEALNAPAANVPHNYGSTTNYAFASSSNAFLDVEGWLAGITNGLRLTVAPHFNATREPSLQIEQELGVKASGEQKLGIFPTWVLSTSISTPDMRYPFISLPPSEWYTVLPAVVQAMEDPGVSIGSMHQLVDFYYNWGGLVNFYSHSSSAGGGIAGALAPAYVTYAMSKPRIWPANAASVYNWWLARSNAVVNAVFGTNSGQSVLTFNISGAKDSQTAVEALVPRPSVSGLQVFTNGVAAGTNNYWTNGPLIKVLVGTHVTNAVLKYYPNPAVQSNFFIDTGGLTLNNRAPGVLAASLPGALGGNLTAALSTGPGSGTLSLTNNGGFAYTPATNFIGVDSFTYLGYDAKSTSAVARATVDVTPPGDLFYDNFVRSTNCDPQAPWTPVLGSWSIGGGQLQGTNADAGEYSDFYVAENWTNYSVQAQIRFAANASGAGLAGRISALSGAKYAVSIYPNGIQNVINSPVALFEKFSSWQAETANPVQANLPPVGTNWHSLQVMFRANRILAYWDGSLIISATDNTLAGGGFGAHFFTYQSPYLTTFSNVVVGTAPIAGNAAYLAIENLPLTVAAPGLLANDSAGAGSNLTLIQLSNPTNGTLNLGTDGGFTYMPATNYVGPDTFAYEVSDGLSTSAVAVVTINVLSNSFPVANNDIYYYAPNTPLIVAAPGILGNDTDGAGFAITPILVSPPALGALSLNTDGSFSYVPNTNFNGFDSFSYEDFDGVLTSAVATVTLSDPAYAAFFYDNFIRATNPGPIAPWIAQPGGNWTVANGALIGGTNGSGTYGNVYLTNTWSDYSVQAQFQFNASDAYGAGLGGRVNPVTGAHYAVWVYPFNNDLNVIKFSAWQTPSVFLALDLTNFPPLGTNTHTLKLAFRGHQIAAYLDGRMMTNLADNASPYTNGGVSVDMYTGGSGYQLSVENLEVDPLATAGSYFMNADSSLIVPATGVLGDDTGVYGTNLAAALVSGPGNGVVNLNSNGGFSYTPALNFVGTDTFTYQASDPATNLGSAAVSITVSAVRNGPALPAQTNRTIDELTTLVVTNTASDFDAPLLTLTYSLVGPPAGAIIDTNGIITWTPSQAEAASTNVITTIVRDNGIPSLSATNSFTVDVNDLNFSPVLPLQPDVTIIGSANLVVTNTATNADINAIELTYQLLDGPTNAAIDVNGVITWTPAPAQIPSTNLFTTVATDYDPIAVNATVLSAANSFTVTVAPPPSIQSINAVNGAAVISWVAVPGRSYMLQYQTSLDSINWSDLPPPITATGPAATATNNFGGSLRRFYRVVLLP